MATLFRLPQICRLRVAGSQVAVARPGRGSHTMQSRSAGAALAINTQPSAQLCLSLSQQPGQPGSASCRVPAPCLVYLVCQCASPAPSTTHHAIAGIWGGIWNLGLLCASAELLALARWAATAVLLWPIRLPHSCWQDSTPHAFAGCTR